MDLDRLGTMHPLLERTGDAPLYSRRGALVLERSQHQPGVATRVDNGGVAGVTTIGWSQIRDREEALAMIDHRRLSEDGAEAIALAWIHEASGWTVRRRLQQGESADWLLADEQGKRMMALEVGGTNQEEPERYLRTKIDQVGRCTLKGCEKIAIVVGFNEPSIYASAGTERGVPNGRR